MSGVTGSPDAAPTPAKRITAPRPKVGGRVRVVLEGEVQADDFTHGRISLGDWPSSNVINPSAAHVVSVEVLTPPAPPEPVWWPPQPGDVILYGASTYLRESNDLCSERDTDPRLLVNRNGVRLRDRALLDMHHADPYFVRLLVRNCQVQR